jgi:hypothetical protein
MKLTRLLKLHSAVALATLLLTNPAAQAQTAPAAAAVTGKTEMLWLGQASWRIKTPGGKVIVIDPWLSG